MGNFEIRTQCLLEMTHIRLVIRSIDWEFREGSGWSLTLIAEHLSGRDKQADEKPEVKVNR